ncbi:MAG: cell wall-binding repeat-containing protein [Lachnospiraceae bacterium]|nr:cell wall-binding repeat-containing protein [Candidatus Equihabitans merdae]
MNRMKKIFAGTVAFMMLLGSMTTTVLADDTNYWGESIEEVEATFAQASAVAEELETATPAEAAALSEELNTVAPVQYVPLWGQLRYDTAARIAMKAFPAGESVDTVVIACGNDFPDALSANGLAGSLDCPLLLSDRGELTAATKELLIDHWGDGVSTNIDKAYLIGLGFSDAMKAGLAEIGLTEDKVVVLGGMDRYETAEEVFDQIIDLNVASGKLDRPVFVASGKRSPDALSVSPISYYFGAPILLTDGATLTEKTQECLQMASAVYILGGTATVQPAAENIVVNIVGAKNFERLAGDDRYLTAAKINHEFAGDVKTTTRLIVAYNAEDKDFPDALSSGMLSRIGKAEGEYTVTMLVKPDCTNALNYITNHFFNGFAKEVFLTGGQTNRSPMIDQIKAAVDAEHNGACH